MRAAPVLQIETLLHFRTYQVLILIFILLTAWLPCLLLSKARIEKATELLLSSQLLSPRDGEAFLSWEGAKIRLQITRLLNGNSLSNTPELNLSLNYTPHLTE